jgi:hypothetical protein
MHGNRRMGAHAVSAVVLLAIAVFLTISPGRRPPVPCPAGAPQLTNELGDRPDDPMLVVRGPSPRVAFPDPVTIEVAVEDRGVWVDADVAGVVWDARRTRELPMTFVRTGGVYRWHFAPGAVAAASWSGGMTAFVSARVGRKVLESTVSWDYGARCTAQP